MRDGPARNAESNFWQGLDNPRVSRAVGYDDSNHGTKELVPDEIRQRTKYNENHRSTPPHPRCRRGAPYSQAARFRKGQLSAALNGHGQFADGRGPLPRSVTGRSGNSNAALEANA